MGTTTTVAMTTQPLDRSFPRGRFHIAKAKGADWQVGLRPYFAYRDLGMAAATEGKVLAHVICARQPSDGPGDEHKHHLDFQMVYVLRGWMRTQFDGVGEHTLEAGDCMYQEPGINHRVLDYSDDLEVLEITIPAEFETVSVAP
jgi:mannose-6-phosphate isomerase-like protein (cupin superfamily)